MKYWQHSTTVFGNQQLNIKITSRVICFSALQKLWVISEMGSLEQWTLKKQESMVKFRSLPQFLVKLIQNYSIMLRMKGLRPIFTLWDGWCSCLRKNSNFFASLKSGIHSLQTIKNGTSFTTSVWPKSKLEGQNF